MTRCKDCDARLPNDMAGSAPYRCAGCHDKYMKWLFEKSADDARGDRQQEDSEVPE